MISAGVVVCLLVAATAVTIWRYDNALTQGDRALEARDSSNRSSLALTAYWRERETMNEYLLSPSQTLLGEVGIERSDFIAAISGLGLDNLVERPIAARASAGNQAFIRTFNTLRGDTTTAVQDRLDRLNQAESGVVGPLASLDIAQQFIAYQGLGTNIDGLGTALATKFSGTVAGLVKQELARCAGKIDGHKRIWEINR